MGSRAQLFIGKLSKDVRTKDLEEIFSRYGRLTRCDIKFGAAINYAFVDFEDRRDAEDAVRYENGREIRGKSIVVEWAKGPNYRFYRDSDRSERRRSRSRSRDRRVRRRSPSRSRSRSDSRSRSRSPPRKKSSSSKRKSSPSRSKSASNSRSRSRSATGSKSSEQNGNDK